MLEDLNPEQLSSLLNWAARVTPDEFEQLRATVPRLSKEQLVALVSLGDAERKKPARSAELQERIDAARERVREEHRQLRKRRAGK
ncbi:MAG: hypothetical protein HYV60_00060 [Planctomycetia bacterium]|nr:hypothetical protein [Planctomycetia bacterium]